MKPWTEWLLVPSCLVHWPGAPGCTRWPGAHFAGPPVAVCACVWAHPGLTWACLSALLARARCLFSSILRCCSGVRFTDITDSDWALPKTQRSKSHTCRVSNGHIYSCNSSGCGCDLLTPLISYYRCLHYFERPVAFKCCHTLYRGFNNQIKLSDSNTSHQMFRFCYRGNLTNARKFD